MRNLSFFPMCAAAAIARLLATNGTHGRGQHIYLRTSGALFAELSEHLPAGSCFVFMRATSNDRVVSRIC